jgi:hypothetical protein
LSFCFLLKTEAQNIIPNPSFERSDTTICSAPSCYFTIDNWLGYNSADLFNICDTSHTAQSVGVPRNFLGYQNPHSGKGYMGFISYSSYGFGREYIEVPLTSQLVSGHTYYVTFYVSLADTVQYAIVNVGALFTDTLFDPFPAPSYNWQTGIPQVENQVGNMLSDKINWVPITDSFIAVGGEKYMTIGNFRNDANTVKQYLGGTTPNTLGAYYYIDDVYVGETPLGVNELKSESLKFEVYPNPASYSITIEFKNKNVSDYTFEILNVLGQVRKTNAELKGATAIINFEDLATGIYFIKAINRINGLVSVRKFVKE